MPHTESWDGLNSSWGKVFIDSIFGYFFLPFVLTRSLYNGSPVKHRTSKLTVLECINLFLDHRILTETEL